MAVTISQILASSYAGVANERKKPENQWAESAFMKALERIGAIKYVNFGPTIEETLDYRRNAGAAVLSTDLQPMSLTKTEVLTAASYTPASVSVPVVWSLEDEAKNPTENQKVDFVDALLNNQLDSHDDLLEETLFTGSNGVIGLDTMLSNTGVGTIGGIDASVETWWGNQYDTFVDDTDIEAGATSVWNGCAKGSGSALTPKLIVSDSDMQALFEGSQQGQQRYVAEKDLNAGFVNIAFKTAPWVFSQYAPANRAAFLNPRSYKLKVAKGFFRRKGKEQELDNANGFRVFIYSAVQVVTNNRSRLGVLHT